MGRSTLFSASQKKIVFLVLLLVAFFLTTCKKNNVTNSSQQSKSPSFGLLHTTASDYANIPTASLPPGSGTNLQSRFFLEIPSTPFNQGQQGSCASCATAMAKSIEDHVELNIPYLVNGIIYSPSYLYNQCMAFPGYCDLGSEIYKNLDILKNKGVCKLSEMPYSETNCTILPSSNQDNFAASHKIDHYFKIDPINTNTIKQFINAGLPVIVGFKVDNHFIYDYLDPNNIDKVWTNFGPDINKEHATLLYGWDDNKNAFRMLNQWGSQWGDNGSIWVDYNLVQNGNVFYQAYIIQNPAISNNGSLLVTGTLDFGDITINTSAIKTIQLKNTGSTNINVSDLSITSPYSTNWNNGTLQPNATTNVSITFNPTSLGVVNRTLTINSDATNSNVTIQASGNGIQQTTQTKIILLSGNLSYGNVTVGQTSSKTLTISNTGNSSLIVSSISSTSQGFSSNYSGTIQAGSSVNVSINFSPSYVQSYDGDIVVNSDYTSGTNTISASGNGVQQTSQTRIISLSGNFSFGNVTVNQTVSSTLTISNNGNSPLNVSNIYTPQGFYSGNYSGTIQAGSSVNVPIAFVPTNVQPYSGNIVVNSDYTSGNNTIYASGNGVSSGGGNPVAFPPIGSYGDCAPTGTNPNCTTYSDGVINARIVSINTSSHQIVVEIKKCNGTVFNAGGNFNVTSNLCSGVSYGFGSFQAGNTAVQMTIVDNDMTGTKVYYPFIIQGSSLNILYDAPSIVVTY